MTEQGEEEAARIQNDALDEACPVPVSIYLVLRVSV